ncbi:unnamed protein product [Durusdinium trenchii]
MRLKDSKLGTALIARSASAEEVLVFVAQNLKRFDAIHCTASLHALAKHSLKDDRLASRTLGALLAKQGEYARQKSLDGRQLSNTLWAIARLRQPAIEAMPEGLATQVAAQLSSQEQRLNHQDVSNGLWAIAALDLPEQADHMSELAYSRALSRPNGFKAQELANAIWAFATCGSGTASRMARNLTVYCVLERLAELQSIQLAAVIWSVAAADLDGQSLRSSPRLMEPLATAVLDRVQEFGPQEVSNVSWALAVETIQNRRLREELAMGVNRCMHEFKRKELVNSLWAFAVFGSMEAVD